MDSNNRNEKIITAEYIRKFFKWMNDRQEIYLKKKDNEPWPWTDDEILQTYKFTNVYRRQDAVTQVLLKELRKLTDKRPMNILFTIAVFRMFNWPATFDALTTAGIANIGEWDEDEAALALDNMQAEGKKLWTGAYMVTGSGSEGRPKHYLAIESLTRIFHDAPQLTEAIMAERTLQYATRRFTEYPMISDFVGYELACDLSYTKVLRRPKDKFTWANPGPGARRGINRIFFGGPQGARLKKEQYIEKMVQLLNLASMYLDIHMNKCELRDIEHSLCEFDKYERVRLGEGRPRSKYQPKRT